LEAENRKGKLQVKSTGQVYRARGRKNAEKEGKEDSRILTEGIKKPEL